MERHPLHSVRISEHFTASSTSVSEKDTKKLFSDTYKYLVNFDDLLQDFTRLLNGDETGFALCPKNKTTLDPKGIKDVYDIAVYNAKENFTLMITFNTVGYMCHPMIIYNYQRIPKYIVNSAHFNLGIGHSNLNWMKSEVFYELIANILHSIFS